ncbi:hypothetical protein CPC08DRAFT_729398 [Agrocybe pediades]|nr:hypothetical protein CPC08DRAFT_729398 [Agrocybe pediades]
MSERPTKQRRTEQHKNDIGTESEYNPFIDIEAAEGHEQDDEGEEETDDGFVVDDDIQESDLLAHGAQVEQIFKQTLAHVMDGDEDKPGSVREPTETVGDGSLWEPAMEEEDTNQEDTDNQTGQQPSEAHEEEMPVQEGDQEEQDKEDQDQDEQHKDEQADWARTLTFDWVRMRRIKGEMGVYSGDLALAVTTKHSDKRSQQGFYDAPNAPKHSRAPLSSFLAALEESDNCTT